MPTPKASVTHTVRFYNWEIARYVASLKKAVYAPDTIDAGDKIALDALRGMLETAPEDMKF